MIFQSESQTMTPKDRANYGFAVVRNAAYDAVLSLWRRRKLEGWTQSRLAEQLGKDTGWVSKNLRGPGNWTMQTFGAFVEALGGEAEIAVHPLEAPIHPRINYHAYAGYEKPETLPRSTQPTCTKLPPYSSGTRFDDREANKTIIVEVAI